VWCCGKIEELKPGWVRIEFLDKRDGDWYRWDSEEIRQCIESDTHHRSSESSITRIEIMNEREREKRRTRRKNQTERLQQHELKSLKSALNIGEASDQRGSNVVVALGVIGSSELCGTQTDGCSATSDSLRPFKIRKNGIEIESVGNIRDINMTMNVLLLGTGDDRDPPTTGSEICKR
jgi:hypothetical protein